MQLFHYLDRGEELSPDRNCFVTVDREWSYAEARARTCGLAAALVRDGLRPGMKAAVVSPNDPEAFHCVLGLSRAQLVWLPINPRYAMEDIADILERFECEALFLHSD